MTRSLFALVLMGLLGCSENNAPEDASRADAQRPRDSATDDAANIDDAAIDDAPDGVGMSCKARVATGSQAVAYQIDTTHTGAQLGDTIQMPLCRRWTANLHGAPSYALVADGRVFVTINDGSSGALSVFALDASSGAIPWGPVNVLGDSFPRATAAYDAGRVFVVNTSGTMFAIDASSGVERWRTDLPVQYSFTAPPTARDGLVFVGGSGYAGTLYAINQSDGRIAWSTSVVTGDMSSPAVTATDVFVSYACNHPYAFDPTTGTLRWHHNPECVGGGGRTVSVVGNRVYARDFVVGNLVLDAADGSEQGSFRADAMPAIADGMMYAITAGVLTATPLDGRPATWSFGSAENELLGPPLVVGERVFVTSAMGLFAINRIDGTLVSSDPLEDIAAVEKAYTGGLDIALAAADGLLLVPTMTGLVAY